ncbi:metallophosphoesterase family protein [Heyndrickxia acidicola]|uniref:Phosphoesterase n=1 Tax=Heyndrickxia acidicola TaxID=209389 RepID=A0ABU6MFF1_9BACI|nr:metallophosphoesterase family protein [Heyndrickxia acidicola]MED1201765.1 metallophosphoesterase family protein [Heyndrickxia acidicola]
MKIIVMSDTHMPKRSKSLPSQLIQELMSADLAIHAGDWSVMEVYKEISQYVRVEGVVGNVDEKEIADLFPEKQILKLKNFSIGVVHGHGKGNTTERRALDAFANEKVDCIIYGHSHIPSHTYKNGILLFNPGSPTDKRRQPSYSFGILSLGSQLTAEHVYFE